MFVIAIAMILALVALVIATFAILNKNPAGAFAAGVIGSVLVVTALLVGSYNTVDEGTIGIPVRFGQAEPAIGPGVHWLAPWVSVKEMDARLQTLTFSSDAADIEAGRDAITAQARGGGNLTLELSVQVELPVENAEAVYREIGTDYQDKVVVPAIRSCARDSTTGLTLEEAFTTKRLAIKTGVTDCLRTTVEPHGINVLDVLVREVDPGETVRQSIDVKQQAEQDLQRASVELEKARVEAQRAAVEAQATSEAERIIACGGTEVGEGDDRRVVPNATCENRQFSDEYLQWLFLQNLDQVGSLIVVDPRIEGQIMIPVPQGGEGQ